MLTCVPGTRWWRALWVPVLVLSVVLSAVACSADSDTTVLDPDRPASEDGPRPTAPGAGGATSTVPGGNPALSGSVDVAELVRRLDALQAETDLCTLLTGQALSNVTGADINLSSLLTDPSGFTQLFGALERTSVHLVDIAQAELDPPLTVLQGLWGSLATVDPRSAEAEPVVARAIASPEVQDANDAVASWISTNCSAD
ncbi:MAG: hypothetical protein ACKO04_08565 [Actinomycetes bacterium]